MATGWKDRQTGGMILSVTLRPLYALVSHMCLTGLPEVAMPYSDMWQDCPITLQQTRPCYAKSSYLSVDPQTLHGNVHQVDHVPNGPTNSAATKQCSLCDSVEASYWSRSLESDATVQADYALTTTTTTRVDGARDDKDNKLCYRRRTARRAVSVKILSTVRRIETSCTTNQSTTKRRNGVKGS